MEIVVELGNLDVAYVANVWKLEQWKTVSKVVSVESRWECSQSSDCGSGWWPCEEGHERPVPRSHKV